MQVKKIVEKAILDTMTPEHEKAVLDSIAKTVSETKQIRIQAVDQSVEMVLAGLKKVEAKMIEQLGLEAQMFQRGLDGKDGKDGKDGEQGPQGPKGDAGRDGINGKDGKDGRDGLDGVSVVDARIDFDGSLTIVLSNGTEINAGEVVSESTAQQINQIQRTAGTGSTSQEVLNTLATLQSTINNLIPSQTGNNGKFLTTDGSVLSWETVGTISIANGGTGQTTANAGFNALSPITTIGDLIVGNGTNSATRLGIGANGYVLTSNGTTVSWQAAGSSMTYPGAGIAVSTGSAWTSSLTAPSGTIVGTSDTQTLTNKTITQRVVTIADATSITINADITDIATQANTQVAGTLTINAPTGTPVNGQKIMLRLLCTNAQTFSWNAAFVGSTDLPLPSSSTGSSKYDYVGFIYNSTTAKWQLLAKTFGF